MHGRHRSARPWECSSSRASAPASTRADAAERVNGYDPLPVIDAFRRKRQILKKAADRPAGHDYVSHQRPLASDASSYRSKEEVEHWLAADSIRAFHKKMVEIGALPATC